MIDDEDAWRMASSGLVSEDGYRDIQLWYFNGNSFTCWLGPLGVDGTGNLYALTFNYGTPRAREAEILSVGRLLPRHEPHIVTRYGEISIYSIIPLDKRKI